LGVLGFFLVVLSGEGSNLCCSGEALRGGVAMSGSGEKVDRLHWISQFVFAVGLLLPIFWAYSGIAAYQADDSYLAQRCGTPIILMIFVAIFASALFSSIAVVLSILSLRRLPGPASAGRKFELAVFSVPVLLGAAQALLVIWAR
jgi:uncharacterized integral membrane protein